MGANDSFFDDSFGRRHHEDFSFSEENSLKTQMNSKFHFRKQTIRMRKGSMDRNRPPKDVFSFWFYFIEFRITIKIYLGLGCINTEVFHWNPLIIFPFHPWLIFTSGTWECRVRISVVPGHFSSWSIIHLPWTILFVVVQIKFAHWIVVIRFIIEIITWNDEITIRVSPSDCSKSFRRRSFPRDHMFSFHDNNSKMNHR